MNTITLSLILLSIAIAFAATLISGLIKIVFFFKQKNTYRHILKFGLLGEGVGLLIIFAISVLYGPEINNWLEPESIIAIPFYLMLVGELTGLIVTFRNKRKHKPAC